MLKKCKKCNIEKSLDSFSKDKQKTDGIRYYCKECEKQQQKNYRINNQEKLREMERNRSERNKTEKAKEAKRKNYNKDSERHRNYSNKWKEKNKEKVK